jgi:hypothetical protein
MRIRVGLLATLGGAFALSCGGQSSSEKVAAGGHGGSAGTSHAGTGAGTSRAGTAGCSRCGSGGAGASDGSGGTDTSAGGSAGTGQGGATLGGSGGAGGSEAGSGGAGTGSDGAGTTSAGNSGSGSAGKGGTAGTSLGSAGESAAGTSSVGPSDGLTIGKVAIYQAVEIPLMVGGDERPANENAPLVAARAAMLRVWLEPGPTFAARDVTAEMTVTLGSTIRTATSTRTVSLSSSDEDLKTTLNFDLDASEVAVNSTVSVVLHEATTVAEPLARWPESGARTLEAQSSSGPFLITLVPLVANGFTPDTSEANRMRYERYMSQIYPAASADVTVKSPLVLDQPVDPDGTGWDDALDQLLEQRATDNVEPNVYYYGLLTPGATFDGYCQNDCVVGLSNVATRTQEQYRGAIGTGYFTTSKDTFSQETLAHELGHALGRQHSPCQTDDGEKAFPYGDGGIGVFGFNGTRLFDPAIYKDVMGYCVPVWISDYTYDHLFERIVYVNGLAARQVPAAKVVRKAARTLRVGIDGRLTWGREHVVAEDDEAETTNVDLLDASGSVLRSVNVVFTPLDHLPGGSLSIPSEVLGDPDVLRVRVGGRMIDVR